MISYQKLDRSISMHGKILISIIFICYLEFPLMAQKISASLIPSSLLNSDSVVLVKSSLGEPVTGFIQSEKITLLQGFYSTTKIIITAIDKSSPSELRIYPNPTSDIIYIESIDNTEYDVSIFNLNGQLIKNDNKVDQISIAMLPRGTYLLKAVSINTNRIYNYKIIKSD